MGAAFEHYIDLLQYDALGGASITNFYRSYVSLNPSDYDGATFYFEVVGSNSSGSTQTVTLYNITTSGAAGTTTLANGASTTRSRGSAFVPTAGANTYCLQLPAVTTVTVQRARIVIVQSSAATKTRICIPLMALSAQTATNTNDNTIYLDSRFSTTYGQTAPACYDFWTYTAADWADIIAGATAVTLETILACFSSTTYTGNAGLSAVTSGTPSTTPVTGSTLAADIASTTPTLSNKDFALSALTDGATYSAVVKSTGATSSRAIRLLNARLYIRLSNAAGLSTLCCYLKQGYAVSSGTTQTKMNRDRTMLTTANYGGSGYWVGYYTDTPGTDSTNEPNIDILADSTNDNGTGGSAITGSAVNYNTATKTNRMGATNWTPPASGTRVYGERIASTGATVPAGVWIVVKIKPNVKYNATGQVDGVSAVSGAVTVRRVATYNAPAAVAGASGTVFVRYAASGTVAGTSGASGAVTAKRAATFNVPAAVSGVSGDATVSGGSKAASGQVNAVSGCSGSVTARRVASGTAIATAGSSANATAKRPASGSVGGVAGASGNVAYVKHPASGTAGAVAGTSLSVVARRAATYGSAAAVTSASASVTARRPVVISTTAAAVSGVALNVTSKRVASYAVISATSAVSGAATIKPTYAVTGLVGATSGASGNVTARALAAGTATGLSGVALTVLILALPRPVYHVTSAPDRWQVGEAVERWASSLASEHWQAGPTVERWSADSVGDEWQATEVAT